MKKLIPLIMILFYGCSVNYANLSTNNVQQSEMVLKGGVAGGEEWRDLFVFKRLSWYHELTLFYDFIYARVDKESKFFNWFSQREKDLFATCEDFLVTLNYAIDESKISRRDVSIQLEAFGYKEISLNQFDKNLKLHPDFESLSFKHYKVTGYCQDKVRPKEVYLTLTGFKTMSL